MDRRHTRLTTAALGVVAALLATPPEAPAQERAAAPAGATRAKVVRVRGVRWQPTLEAALAAAAKARPARPVLWFRVLGDLQGLA